MDSINRNQPEDNYEALQSEIAIAKIRELVNKASSCFFCTRLGNKPFATRPMSVQEVDEQGNLWFLSASDSHKNADINQDPVVQLLFQGSSYSDFLSLFGTAHISRDPQRIKELWNPILKTWFTEGIDDPRITVIQVVPQDGYYWDTKHNQAIAFAKRLVGAALGKTLDDSIEGPVNP